MFKHWVLFPPDTLSTNDLARKVRCDPKCSPSSDFLHTNDWFEHVLPQLRQQHRSWLGQPIIEAVQHPGEIIYVPHDTAQAVLNLDATLTKNQRFLAPSALGELAKFVAMDLDPFGGDFPTLAKLAWGNLYFRETLTRSQRRCMKAMHSQVTTIITKADRRRAIAREKSSRNSRKP